MNHLRRAACKVRPSQALASLHKVQTRRGLAMASVVSDLADRVEERSTEVSSLSCAHNAVVLEWADGHVSEFDFMWLRDHCPTRFDSDTRQRAQLTSGIPLDVKPASASIERIERRHLHAIAPGAALSGGKASATAASETQDMLVIEWTSGSDTGTAMDGADAGTAADMDKEEGQSVRVCTGTARATSHFQLEWLRRACYSEARRRERQRCRDASRTSWGGTSTGAGNGTSCTEVGIENELENGVQQAFAPPVTEFEAAMNSNDELWHAMSSLWRYGLLIVRGVPKAYGSERIAPHDFRTQHGVAQPAEDVPFMNATEAFARRIGFVRPSLYGDMWSFGSFEHDAKQEAMADSSYSNLALALHTDGAYMRDPPALQLWTCMYRSDDGGGVSRYVDGLRVGELLRARSPASYEFLSRVPLSYHCQDLNTSLAASGPVFQHGPDAEVGSRFDVFRYNDYDRACLSHLAADDVREFYWHLRQLSDIIEDEAMEYRMALEPGTMVVVHNHRVMHGRTAFNGTRGLCGCYIGDDEFRSTLRRLAREQRENAHQPQSSKASEASEAWSVLLAEGLDARITPPTSIRY